MFEVGYKEILAKIDQFNPESYGATRNYGDGAVSHLSPYLSRGVISTKRILLTLLDRGFEKGKLEKFVQQLAWRDYWQQVWIAKGDLINADLKSSQMGVHNHQVPLHLIRAETGITAIDTGIKELYEWGYMHNHLRMYVAAIACNIAGSHWLWPSRWMYYHLLDADWASNALSWQWVAGSNSHKKYYANQENINKYFHTQQKNTFLDVSYEEIANLAIPEILKKTVIPELETMLPKSNLQMIKNDQVTYLYNFYNLDPGWHRNDTGNRILLLEPSHFRHYPVSSRSVEFMLNLSNNIEDIRIFVGEFDDLINQFSLSKICYKQHPLCRHYRGHGENPETMFEVNGYYPSFFAFWKKCLKRW
jgi:deoxyribodipyrimidine photo-lyase